jgi:ABC-type transport system involved in Fe-S cluster assembly fused permease/ATPase subunit
MCNFLYRFKSSVSEFQKFSYASQYSVGILNCTQQLILALTVMGAMIIAGGAVKRGEMNIGGSYIDD